MKVIFPQDIQFADSNEMIRSLQTSRNLNFYSDLVVEFCDALSKKLMHDPECKRYPEVTALAFWLRKASILELKKKYIQPLEGTIVLPKGIVFHIAPSNVDTIFLYSWVLSVLCGNKNIVRISSRMSQVTQMIISKFDDVINSNTTFNPIKKITYFVSFDHSDSSLQTISNGVDARVIWGGDGTIQKIRTTSIPSRSIDIGFADRFSHSFFKAKSVLSLNEDELNTLANNFYIDAFLFSQKACSSPRVCFWIGSSQDCEQAQQRFYSKVVEVVKLRQPVSDNSLAMFKLKNAYDWTARVSGDVKYWGPELTNMKTETLKEFDAIRALEYGAGSFVSISIRNLQETLSVFTSRDQTIGYFGFDYAELTEFVQSLNGNKVDRIVPIGQALAFGVIWDGYNLFEVLSRKVALI